MSALAGMVTAGFWRRTGAMLIKEFLQLRRDRITFATMISIPLMQLLLFGYAINTTPRDLPTAVLVQESNDVSRSILRAIENTRYFKVTVRLRDEAEFDRVLQSGKVLFGVEIPVGFERALRRGDRPALLVAADATDPVASGSALAALGPIVQTALVNDQAIPDSGQTPFEIRIHARYNPAAVSQLNIVPGLLGTILTLTMLIYTALSVTREIERGTMENLLSMPITPLEIMLGKIAPYIAIGFLQATLIVAAGVGVVWSADRRQFGSARRIEHSVHRYEFVDRLYIFDVGREPTSGRADGDDVVSAQYAAVGLSVPVRRHAGLGPAGRRILAAHTFHAHRAFGHVEGGGADRSSLRGVGADRTDASSDDDRGHTVPPHARLTVNAG